MARAIDAKFKRSYKDEYDALYEAVFGHRPPADDDKAYGSEDAEADELYKMVKLYDSSRVQLSLNKVRQDESIQEVHQFGWATLPDLLLENVFSHLNMQEKYWASMVCRSWYRAFYLGNSWRTFVFDDKTLTRRRYNYYSGWQVGKILETCLKKYCKNRGQGMFRTEQWPWLSGLRSTG